MTRVLICARNTGSICSVVFFILHTMSSTGLLISSSLLSRDLLEALAQTRLVGKQRVFGVHKRNARESVSAPPSQPLVGDLDGRQTT